MKKLLPLFFLLILFISFFGFSTNVFAQTPTPIDDSNSVPDNIWQIDPEVTFIGKTASRSGSFLDWALKSYKWSEGSASLAAFWVTIRNIIYAFLLLFVLITAFILIITQGKSITFSRFIPRFLGMVFLITFSFALIQFIYQIGDIIQAFFLKKSDGNIISHQDLLYIGFNYKEFVGYRLTGFANDESAFISLLLIKLTAVTYYIMAGILIVRKIILWFFIIISPIFPLLILYKPVRNTAKIWLGEFLRWVLYAPLFTVFLGGLVSLWKASTPTATGIPLNFNNFSGVGSNITYPTVINILLGGPGQQISLSNSVNVPETFALYVVAIIMLWGVIILPFILLRIFLDYLNNLSFGQNLFIKQLLSGTFPLNKLPPGGIGPSPIAPPPYRTMNLARSLPTSSTFTFNKAGEAKTLENVLKERSFTYNSNLQSRNSEILRKTNLMVPTIRDIGRFETSLISSNIEKHREVLTTRETLERIANPHLIPSPIEREKYVQIRENLIKEKQVGNPVASAILSASNVVSAAAAAKVSANVTANIAAGVKDHTASTQTTITENSKIRELIKELANPEKITSSTDQVRYKEIKEQLVRESEKGDVFAKSVLNTVEKVSKQSEKEISENEIDAFKKQIKEEEIKGTDSAKAISKEIVKKQAQTDKAKVDQAATPDLPAVNKVQSVNLDDYEAVKKLWEDNYQNQEVPRGLKNPDRSREEWIKNDISKIDETINLLTSHDTEKVKDGMNSVSNILPFLLIGGFSQTEVIAYLKAKQEAGKTVLSNLEKKEEEDDSKVEVAKKEEEKPREMQMEVEEEQP